MLNLKKCLRNKHSCRACKFYHSLNIFSRQDKSSTAKNKIKRFNINKTGLRMGKIAKFDLSLDDLPFIST